MEHDPTPESLSARSMRHGGEDAAEGGARVEVHHCHHHEPALAVTRIAEDELDEWWEDLDVECKADAFLQFALGPGSHVDVGHTPTAIPIVATVEDGNIHIRARER